MLAGTELNLATSQPSQPLDSTNALVGAEVLRAWPRQLLGTTGSQEFSYAPVSFLLPSPSPVPFLSPYRPPSLSLCIFLFILLLSPSLSIYISFSFSIPLSIHVFILGKNNFQVPSTPPPPKNSAQLVITKDAPNTKRTATQGKQKRTKGDLKMGALGASPRPALVSVGPATCVQSRLSDPDRMLIACGPRGTW